jgi:hypothetical protein
VWRRKRILSRHAGRFDVEGPETSGLGFRDIDDGAVRRQPDAVRKDHRVGDFHDVRAVCECIVTPPVLAAPRPHLAKVGEVKTSMRVEDEIVWPDEAMLATELVKPPFLASAWFEALDPSAGIAFGPARPRALPAVRKPPLLQM